MTLSCRSRESAFWRRAGLTKECIHSNTLNTTTRSNMESPHPEEPPPKKRRFFFARNSPSPPPPESSPQPTSRPSTPPPAVEDDSQAPVKTNGVEDAGELDGFDVGMLQAVVGELSLPTLQKLKDVSGNNVERGPYTHEMERRIR
jgi:hypothetical protein